MVTQPSSTDGPVAFDAPVESGGIDVFDSLLVRQRIRPGQTEAVLDVLADWAANTEGDVRTLLPVRGVSPLTVFLDRGAFGLGIPRPRREMHSSGTSKSSMTTQPSGLIRIRRFVMRRHSTKPT